jgi:glycosyltransferase involved in cell wall biosynthesis
VSVCPELASRAITIRNGVAVDTFRRPPSGSSGSRAQFGFAPGHFVVGAVARLDRRKGLDTLIEALAKLAAVRPEVRLLIVGDGAERRRLFEQSRVLGVESRISWAGHRKDVRPALAAMDLFAAPSRSEGLGVAIIEALAAGVPVVGAAVGGIPELLAGAACARLLPSEQPDAWAEAIAGLVDRGPALAQMAAAAPAHAARFSNAASVAALEELYAHALEQPLEAQPVAA